MNSEEIVLRLLEGKRACEEGKQESCKSGVDLEKFPWKDTV